jgi:hypothetical protein
MLIASQGISQSSNDSLVCIPQTQLKKAIVAIERGKVTQEELTLTQQKLELSDKRIFLKDSVITELKKKNDLNLGMISSYESTIQNNTKQIGNLQQINTLQKKQTRREKYKKWIVGVLGISLGYLISK